MGKGKRQTYRHRNEKIGAREETDIQRQIKEECVRERQRQRNEKVCVRKRQRNEECVRERQETEK